MSNNVNGPEDRDQDLNRKVSHDSRVFVPSQIQADPLSGTVQVEDGFDKDLKEAFRLIKTNANWSGTRAVRDVVASAGFDPRMIITAYLRKAFENKVEANDQPRLIGGRFILYEKCHAATDLIFLITFFLERGNNIPKAILQRDSVISNYIRRKAAFYGIVNKVQNKTNVGRNALTLARIAQAFPALTAKIILDHKIKGKIVNKAFVGMDSLPLLMQHTIFPSLIPRGSDEISDDLRRVALVLNIDMRITLASPKDKIKLQFTGVDELLEQSQLYVDAVIKGSLMPDDMRISALKKGSIIDSDGKLTVNACAVVLAAKKFTEHGSLAYVQAIYACRKALEQRLVQAPPAQPSSSEQGNNKAEVVETWSSRN